MKTNRTLQIAAGSPKPFRRVLERARRWRRSGVGPCLIDLRADPGGGLASILSSLPNRDHNIAFPGALPSALVGLKASDIHEIVGSTVFATSALHDLPNLENLIPAGSLRGVDFSKLRLSDVDVPALSNVTGILDSINKLTASGIAAGVGKRYLTNQVPVDVGPYLLPKLSERELEGLTSGTTYDSALLRMPDGEATDVIILKGVRALLAEMRDDQKQSNEQQIVVMTKQTELIEIQGQALTTLVLDALGQKRTRTASLVTNIVAAGAAVIAAIAAVGAVLFASGIFHPFGGR